ncbi:unnamed protein product, partial [marine sediment metagenome]
FQETPTTEFASQLDLDDAIARGDVSSGDRVSVGGQTGTLGR